ncbi:MAG: hypothetical protein KGD60_02765 [Candidatus Thorarchaeota archaeon]|nr:hypothetical protein [Candidatus Thorarchaeota archaeon]
MSKTSKKKRLGIPLEDFKFDPSELDLDLTQTLISIFDGYRIYRCFDLTFMERRAAKGKAPREFLMQWATLRGVLHKFAAIGPRVPGVEKWMAQRQVIAFISLALLTISAPLLVFGLIFRLEWVYVVSIPLALTAIGAIFLSVLTNAWFNRKVAWAIFDYTENTRGLLAEEKELLHTWTQALIYHAARVMRKEEIKSEKKPQKIYTDEYRGIEIIQEPKGLRKHYVVRILTERQT